ncbi:hypothetical protein GCM10023147_28290 [Tsukamurella soli]|uniref:Helix-turn-helix domain of resolvase n=2 Tax=Tsukamurella soli TaxID=644556 RepID=A0ABP8JRY9_9ACTN
MSLPQPRDAVPDRLGERFERDGIGLVSITEQIDTSTAAGRFGSRPPALTKEQRRHAQLLRAGKVSVDAITASRGCSRTTVHRALEGSA